MKKILVIILYSFLILNIQAQLVIPERDSENRDTITFYDYMIRDNDGFYSIHDKNTHSQQKKKLTGRYMFKDDNERTVDIELKDGIAVGDWQYYTSTFQGQIISSTVSFIDGYKNGTEYVYSFEWNEETKRFESSLHRVTKYNMGKKQHDISYWKNGQVFMESQFDDNGKNHGEYIYYNMDGTTSIQGQYIHGKAVGTWQYFDSNGQKAKTVIYKDGLAYTTTFHSNGKPHIIKTTRNLIFEGHFLNLNEKGDTISHHFYNDGIEQGYQVGYVFTGYWQPHAISYYYTNNEGVIQGNYIQRFADTGRLRVKGRYNDLGIRDGSWEYYQEDGRLYRTEVIENGWVKASTTRWLNDIRTKQSLNPLYHWEAYPSGAMRRQVEETPFLLFSE